MQGGCGLSDPRILHCAETIKGGIATYLRELIPLQAASFGPENLFVVIPESQRAELPVSPGVTVVTYRDAGGRAGNALRLATQTLRTAREFGPSVVHVHSTFAGAMVRPLLALRFRAARVIYCPHGWAWDRPVSPLVRQAIIGVERALAAVCDAVVCISAHERKTALESGLQPAKLVVVRNGVSSVAPLAVGATPQWPDKRLRVLFVGRLDQQKGVDVLYQALRLLGDSVHAVVAGSAVLADHRTDEVPGNVTRIGWVAPGELETLFQSADVLVVPSRWEGFGLIAAEAMRAGLAVVASGVGGLSEVVADGVTGVIVEPGKPEALAEAIGSLSVDTCRKMGAAGRVRFVEQFTMERVHRELCGVYGLQCASDPDAAVRPAVVA